MQLVLDTSVFASSLLVRGGGPARLVDTWREGRFTLVVSSSILAEIGQVLSYPHIRQKYQIEEADISDLVRWLRAEAVTIPAIANVSDSGVRDPRRVNTSSPAR